MANKFISFLKQVAPWTANALATTVPGPVGIVAGIAAKALGKPALTSATPSSDAVLGSLEPLMQTDEGRQQIAQIEADVQKAFQQMQITELQTLQAMEQTDAADRANARQMESKDIWTPRILTIFVCLIVTLLVIAVLKGWERGIDALAAGTLGTVMGYVFRDFSQVLNFWFGTSSGSEEKTKLIASITQNGNGGK
jgi:hypothetical protein